MLPLAGALAIAQTVNCNMSGYKQAAGLKAENRDGALQLAWDGERGDQLRASLALRDGQPMVVERAACAKGGGWKILGRNLTPEYEVTSAPPLPVTDRAAEGNECRPYAGAGASKFVSLDPRRGQLGDHRGSGRCLSADPLVRLRPHRFISL